MAMGSILLTRTADIGTRPAMNFIMQRKMVITRYSYVQFIKCTNDLAWHCSRQLVRLIILNVKNHWF